MKNRRTQRQKPQWRKKPETAGWYWYRENDRAFVWIVYWDGSYGYMHNRTHIAYAYEPKKLKGEWQPIKKPT